MALRQGVTMELEDDFLNGMSFSVVHATGGTD